MNVQENIRPKENINSWIEHSQWQDRWFESSLGTMMMMLVKQPACSFLCAGLSFIISLMTVVEFHSKAGGIQ